MAQPNLAAGRPIEKPRNVDLPSRPPVGPGWFAETRLRVLEAMLWMMLVAGLLGSLNAPSPATRDGVPTGGPGVFFQALTVAAIATVGLVISHRMAGADRVGELLPESRPKG